MDKVISDGILRKVLIMGMTSTLSEYDTIDYVGIVAHFLTGVRMSWLVSYVSYFTFC